MENLILTLRVMCLEGDAPSSTRDPVTRPYAELPASFHEAIFSNKWPFTFSYNLVNFKSKVATVMESLCLFLGIMTWPR